jgi:hypothetical protein
MPESAGGLLTMALRSQLLFFSMLLTGVGTLLKLAFSQDASIVCKQVTSVIVSSGSYCLAADLYAAGVDIQSDDVVVDLHGFCIVGPGDAANTATAIHIAPGRKRVTVRDGCISGFMYGIRSEPGSSQVTIANLKFKKSTFRAALLEGDDIVFTTNIVDEVGGTTVFEDASPMGIDIRGDNCQISLNQVLEVYPTGSGDSVGIAARDAGKNGHCVISDNVVRNATYPTWGRIYGFSVQSSASTVERNITIRQTYGFSFARESSNAANTRDNVSLEEACAANVPGCPDDLNAALSGIDWSNRYSLFRVARAYHLLRDYPNAAIYYLAAAALGSNEGERIVQRHLKFGYITEQQKASADRQSAELLRLHK